MEVSPWMVNAFISVSAVMKGIITDVRSWWQVFETVNGRKLIRWEKLSMNLEVIPPCPTLLNWMVKKSCSFLPTEMNPKAEWTFGIALSKMEINSEKQGRLKL